MVSYTRRSKLHHVCLISLDARLPDWCDYVQTLFMFSASGSSSLRWWEYVSACLYSEPSSLSSVTIPLILPAAMFSTRSRKTRVQGPLTCW